MSTNEYWCAYYQWLLSTSFYNRPDLQDAAYEKLVDSAHDYVWEG